MNQIQLETELIGALSKLNDPESKTVRDVLSTLKKSSFSSRTHRIIYQAMKQLANRNEPLDAMLIEAESKKIADAGTDVFNYVIHAAANCTAASNAKNYAKLLREKAITNFAISKLNDAMSTLQDDTVGDVYAKLGAIEATFSEIMNSGTNSDKGGLKHVSEAFGGWLDNIDDIQKNNGVDRNRFTSGIESLDEVLGRKGIRRGSLNAVGARPKMGKSALMALMANHFAFELKEVVAIFSMEMPADEIAERSITTRTNINPNEFYKRGWSSEVNGRMDLMGRELINSKMYVDDTPEIPLSHIKNECRRIYREHGSIGLICVDYLTLMKAEKAERNDLAYGAITKALKTLAKELNCAVLMLTQLNRGLENRTDKRPVPSDSRDTGQIEQDVDLWIGLYKESVYDEDVFEPGLTEVIARLNRHGQTGTGFVMMRQGFHTQLSSEEGAAIIHKRNTKTQEEEQEKQEKDKFSYGSKCKVNKFGC